MLGQSPLAAVKGAPLPRFMESWVNLKAAINIPLSAWALAQSVGMQLGGERSLELLSRVLFSVRCQSLRFAWLKNKHCHQQAPKRLRGGRGSKQLGSTSDWEPRPLGSVSGLVMGFLSLLPWGKMFLLVVTLFFSIMDVSQNFFKVTWLQALSLGIF